MWVVEKSQCILLYLNFLPISNNFFKNIEWRYHSNLWKKLYFNYKLKEKEKKYISYIFLLLYTKVLKSTKLTKADRQIHLGYEIAMNLYEHTSFRKFTDYTKFTINSFINADTKHVIVTQPYEWKKTTQTIFLCTICT